MDNPIRPSHYKQDDPYEVIKVILAWDLDFCLGNVLKYLYRAGKKDPNKEIEDLTKAIQYLEFKREECLKRNSINKKNELPS